jgi:DNA-binding LacI/PurR family transcriptional regulator
MPTIKDVARASGVSPATVSYVLNNGPKRVKAHTKERVLRTMREMNYHPSAVARGLSRKRMNAIGVVFPNEFPTVLGNPYVGPVLDGILEVATRSHQNVTLFTGQLWSDMAHSLPVYCDGRCDGLILISPREGSDIISALLDRNVPFLLIGAMADEPSASSVDVDNVEAAKSLVAYLIEQGHRRIAYMGGNEDIQSARLRYEGYRLALQEAGIPYETDLVLEGFYTQISGYDRGRALAAWPKEDQPTALFCGSDEIAMGALQALKDSGVSVPKDISVAGFDDIAAAATSAPPLTTVRQPLHRLGERGAEILLARINERQTVGHRESHTAELIIRESVAPTRNSSV